MTSNTVSLYKCRKAWFADLLLRRLLNSDNQLGASYPRRRKNRAGTPGLYPLVGGCFLSPLEEPGDFRLYITRKKFLKKLGLSSLGLNFSGYNLLTFSPLKYLDPESDPNRFEIIR